jgi:hypothetical protein
MRLTLMTTMMTMICYDLVLLLHFGGFHRVNTKYVARRRLKGTSSGREENAIFEVEIQNRSSVFNLTVLRYTFSNVF